MAKKMVSTTTITPAFGYATPQGGASLMLAFKPRTTLIIGSNRLAANRALTALEADSEVKVLYRGGLTEVCEELRWRAERGEIQVFDIGQFSKEATSSSLQSSWDCEDIEIDALEQFLDASAASIQGHGLPSLVFIADTLISAEPSARRSKACAKKMYDICRMRNIPVNVTDIPELCDFTVCASHRFNIHDGAGSGSGMSPGTARATPLQVGVTTNGQGCRLASRIRREIVARLPSEVGLAVEKLGKLRRIAKHSDAEASTDRRADVVEDVEAELNEESTVSSPNRPVEQRSKESLGKESNAQRARRRMKWVAQISEYWPLEKLAALTDEDMNDVLAEEMSPSSSNSPPRVSPSSDFVLPSSQHDLSLSPAPSKMGRVLLVGSGPGHPSLLTLAAHDALTRLADVVLADKLVPSGVLSLIPSHIELRIARKFPGNADGAQQELMDLALDAVRQGKTVVRLKQGDPALYGRVGEEVLFLRKHGVRVIVIPGISSALAAPLFAGIPVTQRGAADSLAIATGVGRAGAKGRLPGYERARTLVLLMGNARLESLVKTLLSGDDGAFTPYPTNVPAAIIERASMPDQRVITAPLNDIVSALESVGEQRPPGLLVVGWAVLSLWGNGDMSILDEVSDIEDLGKRDKERVQIWLEGRRWRVEEGHDSLWDLFRLPGNEVYTA